MQSIQLQSHVGPDGILKLHIPVGMADVDLEVLVVVQPLESAPVATESEALGWPPGFFERTFGSFRDEPLAREPHDELEVRDELE